MNTNNEDRLDVTGSLLQTHEDDTNMIELLLPSDCRYCMCSQYDWVVC